MASPNCAKAQTCIARVLDQFLSLLGRPLDVSHLEKFPLAVGFPVGIPERHPRFRIKCTLRQVRHIIQQIVRRCGVPNRSFQSLP
jgi:hypothetical protein